MAIYRIGGYAPGLIRDAEEEPKINSPDSGEPLLLKSLEELEEYSRYLVLRTNTVTEQLKQKMLDSSKISLSALESLHTILNEFSQNSREEIAKFDQLVSTAESIGAELSCIDDIYKDVLQLSDMLSSLEHDYPQN